MLLNKLHDAEFRRFILIGGSGAVMFELSLYGFSEYIPYWIGYLLAFEIINDYNFIAHDKWTFRNEKSIKSKWARFIVFQTNAVIYRAIQYTLFFGFALFVNIYLALFFAICGAFFYSYLSNKNITFRGKQAYNYFTEKRQNIIRSMLHTHNLDIGCGYSPITPESMIADPLINGISCVDLPYKDESFDSVTALEIFEHLNMDELLYTMYGIKRILKHEGQLIISIPNYSWYMYHFQNISWLIRRHTTLRDYEGKGHINMQTPEFYRSLLTHYGFEVKEEKRMYLYEYIFRAIKV